MFRFVHAADLHLDSPFRGLGSGRGLKPLFQDATLGALARIVDLCLRERVSFLLLAGDLYDAQDRSVKARLGLREQLRRLDGAGIPTFIVHGNHDPLLGEGAQVALPASVKVFGASWEEVAIQAPGGGILCRVQGMSHAAPAVKEDLSAHFGRQGPEFTVGLLHANLGGAGEHAPYAPCTAEGLAARGLDYWALGHVHTRSQRVLANGGWAAYPGNPQGRHVGETGERGCLLVEVDPPRATLRFFPVDQVRWHQVRVEIAEVENVEGLLEAAWEAIQAICEEGMAHAVRLILEGRGPVHHDLSSPGALAEFEEALGFRLGAWARPVLLESIEDESLPAIDLDLLAKGGGLAGAVLQAATAGGDEAFLQGLYEQEELVRLEAALRRAAVPWSRPEARQRLFKAAVKAVELLVEEPR